MNASTRAKEKYNKNNYDSITFRIQKGQKELVKIAAECSGVSLNEFIASVVLGEVFRVFCREGDEPIYPQDVTGEEWVAYKRKQQREKPDSIKPKTKRPVGLRDIEKERYLLEAGLEKKKKIEALMLKEGIRFEQ